MTRYSSLLVVVATVAGCNALVGVGDLSLAPPDASMQDVAAPDATSDDSRDGTSDGPPRDATTAPIEEPGEPEIDANSADVPDEGGDDAEASSAPDGAGPEAGIDADAGTDAADAEPLPDANSAPDSAPTPDAEIAGDAEGGNEADADQAQDDAD